MSVLGEVRLAGRLVRDLDAFLRGTHTLDGARAMLAGQLARREETFLTVLARGVFGNPRSPYRPLLRRARVEHADVAAWMAEVGLEGALGRLHEAGVHVTLDEFKGRCPIRRPGLEHAVAAHDFDNPLLGSHYDIQSGGSRSPGRRARIDLACLDHEAASDLVCLHAFGALGRPVAIWRPALPAGAAMKASLRYLRTGMPVERWFTQNPFRPAPGLRKQWLFLRYALWAARRAGRHLPVPVHVPVDRALEPARWLAEVRRRGTPAYLDATVSSAVRVCMAAAAHGLDIRGTLVRAGGEPLTEARAQIIAGAGCRVLNHYHMAEVGRLGIACPAPAAVDEVHVMTDSTVLLPRERPLGGEAVTALFCTTLHTLTPKIMLNVELGDTGELHERACGCPFDALGFRQHLRTIRSYEKLTSEGMHFIGTDLIRLVEDVLPARFGGHATDYQLIEEDAGGLPCVSVVVSPRVGTVDEAAVVATALEVLAGGDGGRAMMAALWKQAGTLRVVRREPHATSGAKIHAWHVPQGR